MIRAALLPTRPSTRRGRGALLAAPRAAARRSTTSRTWSSRSLDWLERAARPRASTPPRGRRPSRRSPRCSWLLVLVAGAGLAALPGPALRRATATRAAAGADRRAASPPPSCARAGRARRWPRAGTATPWSTASGRWRCARSSAAGSTTLPAPPPTRSPSPWRGVPRAARGGSTAAPASSTRCCTATGRPPRDQAAGVLASTTSWRAAPMTPRRRPRRVRRAPARGLAVVARRLVAVVVAVLVLGPAAAGRRAASTPTTPAPTGAAARGPRARRPGRRRPGRPQRRRARRRPALGRRHHRGGHLDGPARRQHRRRACSTHAGGGRPGRGRARPRAPSSALGSTGAGRRRRARTATAPARLRRPAVRRARARGRLAHRVRPGRRLLPRRGRCPGGRAPATAWCCSAPTRCSPTTRSCAPTTPPWRCGCSGQRRPAGLVRPRRSPTSVGDDGVSLAHPAARVAASRPVAGRRSPMSRCCCGAAAGSARSPPSRCPSSVKAIETTRSRGRLYRKAGDRAHAAGGAARAPPAPRSPSGCGCRRRTDPATLVRDVARHLGRPRRRGRRPARPRRPRPRPPTTT